MYEKYVRSNPCPAELSASIFQSFETNIAKHNFQLQMTASMSIYEK